MDKKTRLSLLGDGATFMVAADDATKRIKDKADFICDGSADNVQIQDALDALTVGRNFKERIRLVGSFVQSDAIVMPSYATLDMREANLIRDAESTFNIIEIKNKSYADIIGGIIDGNDANVTPKGNDELTQMNILLQDATYCSVRGVRVIDATQNGIYLYDNCLYNRIEGNWVDGNRRAGILLFYLNIADGPKHNVIAKNFCINTLVNRPGIYLSGDQTRYNVITANICRDNTGNGIRLDKTKENTIVGNISEGNDTGVYVTNEASDNLLAGNYLYGNDTNGLYFLNNCLRNSAINNVAAGNGNHGLRSGGKYTRFCDNLVYNNEYNGIQMEPNAHYSVINDNLVLNNSQDTPGGFQGIYLWDVTYCTCSGNIAVDDQGTKTQSRGIYEGNSADYNIITGNVVTPNRTSAYIRLAGANTICKDNIGFVSENEGAAANINDGGTIAHGLAGTPSVAVASPSVASEIVSVTGLGAANITVAIKEDDGTPGTQQTIYWRAWL